jgi:hypothetical protein
MKITELIQPGGRKPLPAGADIDDIWLRILTRHCTEAIAAYRNSRGKMLYRGMKTRLPWFRAASHQARRPKDSNTAISGVFDRLLVRCGAQALRSNSVFATSDYEHTTKFGDVYVIFPIDGFQFTYTNSRDLVLEDWRQVISRQLMADLTAAYVRALKKREGKDWEMDTTAYSWITHRMYHDLDLSKSLERLQHLSDEKWIHELAVGDLFSADDFCARYMVSTGNLARAVREELEVMIQGQYYAFRKDLYGKSLKELVER